jgi:hypothetical protein
MLYTSRLDTNIQNDYSEKRRENQGLSVTKSLLDGVFQHFCLEAGSNPSHSTLFVVLCCCKELQKVHQPFCPGNAKIGLRNSRDAAPKPDLASDLPVFA